MTSRSLHIELAQMNPTVGAVAENANAVHQVVENTSADLVVFPELTFIGYPPQDLLHSTDLLDAQDEAVASLCDYTVATETPTVIIGVVARTGDKLRNSLLVIADGEITAHYSKQLLPTYSVFEEDRYFTSGSGPKIVSVNGYAVGLSVCEDAWWDVQTPVGTPHSTNPIEDYAGAVDVLVNISASPFYVGKPKSRIQRFMDHSHAIEAPVVFVNQVGANDELVFDGNSFVVDGDELYEELPQFTAKSATTEIFRETTSDTTSVTTSSSEIQQLRSAIVCGIRDYFEKTGFESAIIGLSGGIDSSVVATLATDALGVENVYGVSLPSTVTAQQSIQDAKAVATNLGITFETIPISDSIETIENKVIDTPSQDTVTRENIHARIRGVVLMGLANSQNSLVLTPDNKSESGVGYCTLYGDTVGALAPLGDVYKKNVYALARSYNTTPPNNNNNSTTVIPESVLTRKPTAELAPNQRDQDDLPPYDKIDPILKSYIEEKQTVAELCEMYTPSVVRTVLQRLHNSEFKRHQTPPVIRVTKQSLGQDWRYPIAAKYTAIQPD